MKKGSVARHCNKCNRIVFWLVPTGKNVMGIMQEVETKKVVPYLLRESKYWCKECYEKYESEGK